MLVAFVSRGTVLDRIEVREGEKVPEGAVWLDLLTPTAEEDRMVEKAVGVAVPTREEMAEIEPSSRLYIENGARFMTATLVSAADTPTPTTTVVTFILGSGPLVTVRYDDPRPFAIAASRLSRYCMPGAAGVNVLIDLLDAIIDRAADVLERTGSDIDAISRRIFERGAGTGEDASHSYKEILKTIGQKGDLNSKVRESMVSINRLVLFLANDAEDLRLQKEQRSLVKSMARDVSSLADHASFLANKIIFLLDATLGMVTLEQNNVIKIFSVVAVVFLPPTLVATIYGMNFAVMPELQWTYGYPFALFMMLGAAILPYAFFKWRKWL
jgi:magnesium transporter